jgi:glycosyltransferase involved in cell wall biosynthesis
VIDVPDTSPEPPLLSVIIPTFRRERQLVRAIDSVLAQGLASLEVLVLDDSPEGSAAGAVAELAHPAVTYEQMATPSGGFPALVRNHGIGRAGGRYLYFLDDDDQVAPGGLRALLDALEARPSAAVAYGRVRCVGPDQGIADRYNRWFSWARDAGRRARHSSWLTTGVIMFRGTTIINSACMVRREVAVELGGYDPALAVYEDVEFFTRAIRRHGHVFVDHDVLVYSTGLPSLIHDLDGDNGPIGASYTRFHEKYRNAHGQLDYRLLQVVSKALPLGGPPLA